MIKSIILRGFIRHGAFFLSPSADLRSLLEESITAEIKEQLKEQFNITEADKVLNGDYVFVTTIAIDKLALAVADTVKNYLPHQILTSNIGIAVENLPQEEERVFNTKPIKYSEIAESWLIVDELVTINSFNKLLFGG